MERTGQEEQSLSGASESQMEADVDAVKEGHVALAEAGAIEAGSPHPAASEVGTGKISPREICLAHHGTTKRGLA